MNPIEKSIRALLIAAFFAIVVGIPAIHYGRSTSSTGELRPIVDPLTHCQYLESRNGSLFPRMDVDGRQLGCQGSIARPGQPTKSPINAPKG